MVVLMPIERDSLRILPRRTTSVPCFDDDREECLPITLKPQFFSYILATYQAREMAENVSLTVVVALDLTHELYMRWFVA
jgi:hypothetical protein